MEADRSTRRKRPISKENESKEKDREDGRKSQNSKPGNFLRFLGRALGVTDSFKLRLWRENFLRRILEKEVGVCVRNSCGCCVPLCNNCPTLNKPDPRRFEEIKTDQKRIENKDGVQKGNEEEISLSQIGDYGYGGDGLTYYKNLHKLETKLPRDVSGQRKPTFRPKEVANARKELVEETVLSAETDGGEDTEAVENDLRQIDRDLQPIKHKFPWFILIVSILQFIFVIILLITGGIAPIGVEPKVKLVKSVTTFRGREDYDVWHRPNIWIGPGTPFLISAGAIYTPCMRTDKTILAILAAQQGPSGDALGCCLVKKKDLAGTATQKECKRLTMAGGTWLSDVCSSASSVNVTNILKPCCYGLLGSCKMTTEKGCEAYGGSFSPNGEEHCRNVFCFPHVCGAVGTYRSSRYSFMPKRISQGWRFITSSFYHAGILHYALVLTVQWLLGKPIEAAVGPVRMALVYFSGAIGGNIFGAFFNPYLPHVGCSGAVFGLVTISFVELMQARKRILRFAREMTALILLALFLIVSGLFPLLSNFAHLGGVVFALPMALFLMPHLCFGRWNCKCRKIIVIVCAVLLVIFFIAFVVLFFFIQDTGFCKKCNVFSCVPFTENVCNFMIELLGTISSD